METEFCWQKYGIQGCEVGFFVCFFFHFDYQHNYAENTEVQDQPYSGCTQQTSSTHVPSIGSSHQTNTSAGYNVNR